MLQDRAVLITGANGGLGHAVTQAFLDADARVVGVARKIQDSEFANPRFSAISADISTAESARALVAAAQARLGRIDALIHLVGGFAGGKSVAETDDGTLEKMFALNFHSAFHLVQAVLPAMQKQKSGAIVAIGSRAAVEPQPMLGAYSASKAALVSLIRTVALENKEYGISANVVLPGTMDTPANRSAMPGVDPARWVRPEQIAALLVHLASCNASQVTGAVIPVYGAEL